MPRQPHLPKPHIVARPPAVYGKGAGGPQLEIQSDEVHALPHTDAGGVAHGHLPQVNGESVPAQLPIGVAPIRRHHPPREIRRIHPRPRLLQKIHRRQKHR